VVAEDSSDLAVILLVDVDVLELVEEEVDLFLYIGVLGAEADATSAFEGRPVEKINDYEEQRPLHSQTYALCF
jgi:hypothetical protein